MRTSQCPCALGCRSVGTQRPDLSTKTVPDLGPSGVKIMTHITHPDVGVLQCIIFFGRLPVNTIWNLHTCRLEQHCMSRPHRRIFPALASVRGRHEMLGLELAGFVMVLDLLRCSSLGADADEYVLEIVPSLQAGLWRWSSSLVEPVAVHGRAGGWAAARRPRGLWHSSKKAEDLPRPLSMMTDGRDFPTAISA